MDSAILTFLIFWPLVAAGITVLIRADRHDSIRIFALCATLVEFAASLYLLFAFRADGGADYEIR